MFFAVEDPPATEPPADSGEIQPEADDASLLARSSRREVDAFASLVRRHQAGLVRFLEGMIGRRGDAEDLAQEALLAAFRGASDFDGRSTVRSWLFAIAKNAAREFSRSHRRRRARELEASSSEKRDPPDPSEAWARELLEQLPEKFREALLLCDVNGFTYEEAAQALGCPVKTLSTRLFRARERMAILLKNRDLG